jgi:hypothetical protein
VLLPSDGHRKPITSITAVLLPFVTYLLTLPHNINFPRCFYAGASWEPSYSRRLGIKLLTRHCLLASSSALTAKVASQADMKANLKFAQENRYED